MAPARPSSPYSVGDDGVATWSGRHADAWIGRAFFDALGAEELETLASVFGRMAPHAVESCTD
jgi:hypothetical protein